MAQKRVGVVLSGCGYLDGSEIHEAVLTLLAIDRLEAEAVCFAPDVDQPDVIDHLTGQPVREDRRVRPEAARIARGQVHDLALARSRDMDALIVPGGYGAAKTLCDFAAGGANVHVNADLARLVRELHAEGKPMGFWCIAPVVAAAVFEGSAVRPVLTIGRDEGAAARLEKLGAVHDVQPVTGITVDRVNHIVSTPCYMLATRLREVEMAIMRATSAVLEMAAL